MLKGTGAEDRKPTASSSHGLQGAADGPLPHEAAGGPRAMWQPPLTEHRRSHMWCDRAGSGHSR